MLFQLSKSSSRCCLPVQSAQQLHDAKKHTMAQKDSSGSTHSVEEVAGEQHREDGDQQQAPVQGSSVQLHWQHGIIGAGLRQCLQHHWWFHCRDLHCVASKGTTKGWGLDGLDNKNLLLLSAGEKPKAGNGGKDEERRTTGHCDTRLGGFSLSLSAWSPKCSDLLKIDPWKCEICAAINICGTCIKKTFRHELTQLSIEQVNTQPSTPSADFLSLGKGQEGLKPCSVSLSCHLEKIPVIYGLTLSEQKREDPFPLHSILVRAPSTPWPTMLSLIPASQKWYPQLQKYRKTVSLRPSIDVSNYTKCITTLKNFQSSQTNGLGIASQILSTILVPDKNHNAGPKSQALVWRSFASIQKTPGLETS